MLMIHEKIKIMQLFNQSALGLRDGSVVKSLMDFQEDRDLVPYSHVTVERPCLTHTHVVSVKYSHTQRKINFGEKILKVNFIVRIL